MIPTTTNSTYSSAELSAKQKPKSKGMPTERYLIYMSLCDMIKYFNKKTKEYRWVKNMVII